ncbi:MAG: hypothetical protein JOZ02_21695 [Acidobacteria bacterium]|nr:hypothetical protein [Acidobacteriota bacterium]
MKKRLTTVLVLLASLLCNAPAAPAQGGPPAEYTATVKSGEARFKLPVPRRHSWQWRRIETKESGREYAFDVQVLNEGREYKFGLFLWKFPGAQPGVGNFASLVGVGQKSLFERASNGHNVIVRDAGVKVREDGERLIITVSGRKNVERLFSGRPSEVTIETIILDEPPTSQKVPVTYEN